MRRSVVSFAGSKADPQKLQRILAQHQAIEQARMFRGLLLKRLLVLTVATWAFTWVHVLPWPAFWAIAGMAAASMASAVGFELHAQVLLTRELSDIDARTHDIR